MERLRTTSFFILVSVCFAAFRIKTVNTFSPTIPRLSTQSLFHRTVNSSSGGNSVSPQSLINTKVIYKGKLQSFSIKKDEDTSGGNTVFPTSLHVWSNSKKNKRLLVLSALIITAVAFTKSYLMTVLAVAFHKISSTKFYQVFSLVFVSDIGDKTFFIAGLLAMKTGKFISFIGSVCALTAMAVLSVVIGQLFHAIPSGISRGIPFDSIIAVVAFTFFGAKTLKEASEASNGDKSEIIEGFVDAEEVVRGSQTIRQVTTC